LHSLQTPDLPQPAGKGWHGASTTNPYASLTACSERADTFEDMRFLVVAAGWLTILVLVVPTHV